MTAIEVTREMADRWDAHLKYVSSLCGAGGWKKVTLEKAEKVIKLYDKCGSKRMVSRDLHIAPLTVRKILDAQGVPA